MRGSPAEVTTMTRQRIVAGALIAAIVVGVGMSAPAAEVSPRDQQAIIPALEQQSKRLTEAARNTKGGPQQELLLRRERIRSLVERLERGGQVDPQEIDRLLR